MPQWAIIEVQIFPVLNGLGNLSEIFGTEFFNHFLSLLAFSSQALYHNSAYYHSPEKKSATFYKRKCSFNERKEF